MIVVMDFSNLAYSCFYSRIRQENIDAEECPPDFDGHVETFGKKTADILRLFSYEKFVFALDKRPKEKFRIFGDYKKGRKKLVIDPKLAPMKLIEQWQADAIYAEDHEADDAIAAYVAENYEKEIVVVTTDKDLWQLCEFSGVRIFNFHQNMFIGKAQLLEGFRLTKYSSIKLHKTLWGDFGDNVPNVVPRMQKQLLPLIEESDGTLADLYRLIELGKDVLSGRCRELLEQNEKQIRINYELVRLNYDCPVVERKLEPRSEPGPQPDPVMLAIEEIPF